MSDITDGSEHSMNEYEQLRMFNLVPEPIPASYSRIRRRITEWRHAGLKKLMLKYHICPGPKFWDSWPWKVERDIQQAIKHAKPFTFPEMRPDKPHIAALRRKLHVAMMELDEQEPKP